MLNTADCVRYTRLCRTRDPWGGRLRFFGRFMEHGSHHLHFVSLLCVQHYICIHSSWAGFAVSHRFSTRTTHLYLHLLKLVISSIRRRIGMIFHQLVSNYERTTGQKRTFCVPAGIEPLELRAHARQMLIVLRVDPTLKYKNKVSTRSTPEQYENEPKPTHDSKHFQRSNARWNPP